MSLWEKEVIPAYEQVDVYSELPLPADAIDETYLVLNTEGPNLAGLYHSDGLAWFYLGTTATTMVDDVFLRLILIPMP